MRKIKTLIYIFLIGVIGVLLFFRLHNLYLDKKAFNQAQTENSENAYLDYITNFPKGVYLDKAIKLADILAFDKAKTSNRVSSYSNYLNSHPSGCFTQKAEERLFDIFTKRALTLEKKLYWREALIERRKAYRLIKTGAFYMASPEQEEEVIDRIETCKYELAHPVKWVMLEEIDRKPVGFLGWSKTDMFTQYSFREYSHEVITFEAESTSNSATPIRSIVIQLVSWLFHEEEKDCPPIEILKGRVLYPGKTLKTKFRIKVENGLIYAVEAKIVEVNGIKLKSDMRVW